MLQTVKSDFQFYPVGPGEHLKINFKHEKQNLLNVQIINEGPSQVSIDFPENDYDASGVKLGPKDQLTISDNRHKKSLSYVLVDSLGKSSIKLRYEYETNVSPYRAITEPFEVSMQ